MHAIPSFVEEGKAALFGKRPPVNCWTTISISGKEYVVEKQTMRDKPKEQRLRPMTADGKLPGISPLPL